MSFSSSVTIFYIVLIALTVLAAVKMWKFLIKLLLALIVISAAVFAVLWAMNPM